MPATSLSPRPALGIYLALIVSGPYRRSHYTHTARVYRPRDRDISGGGRGKAAEARNAAACSRSAEISRRADRPIIMASAPGGDRSPFGSSPLFARAPILIADDARREGGIVANWRACPHGGVRLFWCEYRRRCETSFGDNDVVLLAGGIGCKGG